jgi:hypothetical protein
MFTSILDGQAAAVAEVDAQRAGNGPLARLMIPALKWPEPPAPEVYHGVAGDIVRAIDPATEADPVAILVQFLIGYGCLVGRNRYFVAESVRHYSNEFAVIVGDTSKGRKGSSWGRCKKLLAEADEKWVDKCIGSGLSSGEGLIWAVRDPVVKRERINHGKDRSPTFEEVEADAGIDDKRLLVIESEYANVLHQHDRSGNNLSVILRQAWDGEKLRTLTKNSPVQATGAHIGVVGHITIQELRRYMSETEQANGGGNRHLWVCARRSKLLPEGGTEDHAALAQCRIRLAEAVTFGKIPDEVVRDDDARSIWRAIYSDLSAGKPGLTGAMLGRAEAHVMRLAMIYALLDCSPMIRRPHLLAAVALWDYVEHSVRFVFGDQTGDPVADDILRLLRGAVPKGVTRTDISAHLGRNIAAGRIAQALALLDEHKLARPETLQGETGGRPAEWWSTR